MNFNPAPELTKLRRVVATLGPAAHMPATFRTNDGDVSVDLPSVLLELASRLDALLHFVDPTSRHHTGTPVPRTPKLAEDNPTGTEGLGGP